MSPTHANKKGTRYRYYISRSLLDGSAKAKAQGQRIPAVALESLVVRRVRGWLADPAGILHAIRHAAFDALTQKRLIERARDFAKQDHDLGIEGLRAFMRSSIVRVQVHADRIDIMLDQDQVCRYLDETAKQTEPIENPIRGRSPVTMLSIPARLKRTGKEMRIIVGDGSDPATPDTGLVRLLVRANAIRGSASRGSKPDVRGYRQIRGRRSVLCDAAVPSHDIGARHRQRDPHWQAST